MRHWKSQSFQTVDTDLIELEDIDFNLTSEVNPSKWSGSELDLTLSDSQFSPIHHENSPILKNKSSIFATYHTFDRNSPTHDLTTSLLNESLYQNGLTRHSQSFEAPSMNRSLSPSKYTKYILSLLWIHLSNSEWAHILSFLDFEELSSWRSISRRMNAIILMVPLEIDEHFDSLERIEKMMHFHIARFKIRSLESWKICRKYEKIHTTIRILSIWVGKRIFPTIEDDLYLFLRQCNSIKGIELRYMYNSTKLPMELKNIKTLKQMHLCVQSQGEIRKIVQDFSNLELALDIEWCSLEELFMLSKLKKLTSISIPCLSDLLSNGIVQLGEPIFQVYKVHGKCFSIRQFLYIFHHFPNATDRMEWSPLTTEEGEATPDTTEMEDLTVDDAIQDMRLVMLTEAKQMKLSRNTIHRLEEQFNCLSEGNFNVWETIISIIDSYYTGTP